MSVEKKALHYVRNYVTEHPELLEQGYIDGYRAALEEAAKVAWTTWIARAPLGFEDVWVVKFRIDNQEFTLETLWDTAEEAAEMENLLYAALDKLAAFDPS